MRHNVRMNMVAILLSLFFIANNGYAENISVSSTLEVSVKSLNVRDTPPWFSWKTLFTFKYVVNPPIAILKKGAQVKVKETVLIGNDQRWVRIIYDDRGTSIDGWIYVGQYPKIVNVKKIDKVSEFIHKDDITTKFEIKAVNNHMTFPFSILFSSAFAAEEVQLKNDQQVEPTNQAPTIQVLVFQLIYVAVFILSFWIFYKMTNDKWLTSFGASAVLLIFGFLSQSSFIALANIFNSTP